MTELTTAAARLEGLDLVPGMPLPACAVGGTGALRAAEPPIIAAQNDLEAVAHWLAHKANKSKATRVAYWTHVERLLLWGALERGKSLSELLPEDYLAYERFLKDPQPADRWIAAARIRRGDAGWKPFRGPQDTASRRLAFDVIRSLLGFLHAASYLRANPLAIVELNHTRDTHNAFVERFLDSAELAAVWTHLSSWRRETKREIDLYERARWALTLLFVLDLRRSEACSHTMAVFKRVRRPRGEQWWAEIVGKGNKRRVIPVPQQALIPALIRYRRHKGAPDLPCASDAMPLICRLGTLAPITANMLYRLIKELFAGAANDLELAGDSSGAEHLRAAATHYLRHTGITAKGDQGVALKYRGRSAGHADLTTTTRYEHAEQDLWWEEMQKATLPWETAY